MSEDTNAGAEPVEKPQGVETPVAEAPKLQEPNYEELLAEKEAELQKAQEERDNYRRGMLKAKGKVQEETFSEEESDEDKMRRIAREEALSIREQMIQREKDDLIKKALKENSELKIALKNKAQLTPASGASADSSPDVKDTYWSPEQIASLKAMGVDPEKVKGNVQKYKI